MSFENLSKNEQTKILNRIQRLKAMADDSASENESMIASRRLYILLAKYDIDLSYIESGEREVAQKSDFFKLNIKARWAGVVLNAISQLYFCQPILNKGGVNNNHYYLVGRKTHVEMTMDLTFSIIKTIHKEAKRQYEEVKHETSIHGKTWINNFCMGASNRVYDRCMTIIEEGKAGILEDEEGTTLPSLVPLYKETEQEIKDALAGTRLRKSPTSSYRYNPSASERGQSYGNNVSLNKGNLSKASPKLLV